MSEPRKHVVIRLAHGVIVALWSFFAALGALAIAPLLIVFEVPAAARYVRMESM